jgi:hypothetical protein
MDDDIIEFSGHYSDMCTDKGFQFEFTCSRCGAGYRTKFDAYGLGTVTQVLDGANSLFGGIFGHASNLSERVRSAGWQKAHDKAFIEALEELKEPFIQCPRCQSWVCKKKCWNDKKGLCKGCAPDLGVEMSAAQSSRSVEEVWAHAAMAEEDKKLSTENWRETIVAQCPKCQHPLETNAKFCPNCGCDLKPKNVCPKCGAKLPPKSKFCPDCGEKIE